ncbi:MAG: hypothetical protein KF836_08535 [Fimbriimonadaceae bacterium]|nr:hypothetical protein [Fimbriimonadaceae bacterium]
MDAPEPTQPKNLNSAIGFVLAMAGIGAFFAFTMWTWNTKNGVIPENQRVIATDSHGGGHGEASGHGDESHGDDRGTMHEGDDDDSHEEGHPVETPEPSEEAHPHEPGEPGH